MPLSPGTRRGPYEILAPLGAGGMGEVYRARDTRLQRDVAIKALPEEFAQDAERLARFQREARLLASLNHPNIAAIYGLEEADGGKYLVLEIVEGESLAERLAAGPMPVTADTGRRPGVSQLFLAGWAASRILRVSHGRQQRSLAPFHGRQAGAARVSRILLQGIRRLLLSGWPLDRLHVQRVRAKRGLRPPLPPSRCAGQDLQRRRRRDRLVARPQGALLQQRRPSDGGPRRDHSRLRRRGCARPPDGPVRARGRRIQPARVRCFSGRNAVSFPEAGRDEGAADHAAPVDCELARSAG